MGWAWTLFSPTVVPNSWTSCLKKISTKTRREKKKEEEEKEEEEEEEER